MEKIQKVIDIYKSNSKETYTSITDQSYLGDFEVFDITVDNDSHTYWTGGLSVSNCAEQSLEDGETCCLAEEFLSNISSEEEHLDITKLLYRINKHSLTLGCHQEKTDLVVKKNMRMGIGVTGVCQASKEQLNWLSNNYPKLREYDDQYSKEKGFNRSIKLTTVKPSGTLSLLAGVTPGCHPGYAQYFIRRIRIASGSSLVDVCNQHGYKIEYQKNFDGSEDRSTFVVEFPCAYPEGTKLAKDMTAIDQLELVKWLQINWSDNSVSCTIYYKKEELEEIKDWLKINYNTSVKTCSFLLHSEHGFLQAPYEEITKEQYEELIKNTKTITSVEIEEKDFILDECATGACPIK